jgi:hypothetical protein
MTKCGICGRHGGLIVMDHDHGTGLCREFLCQSCNVTIGAIERGRLGQCLAYIKKWKGLHAGGGLSYDEYRRLHQKVAGRARRNRRPLLPEGWRAGALVKRSIQ